MGRMASDKSIIAVVDDEWSVRTMLGRVLRLAGYRVAAFAGGEDFMTSLATRLPQCAIVDIHMPRMSGFDVQARLLGAKLPVPVILITASREEYSKSVLTSSTVALLQKPFDDVTLFAAIAASRRGAPRAQHL